MELFEAKLASHNRIYDVLPERFATITRIPENDFIKVEFVDSSEGDDRNHFVAADCLEDIESMADLLHNQLGGNTDEYLGILKFFMG